MNEDRLHVVMSLKFVYNSFSFVGSFRNKSDRSGVFRSYRLIAPIIQAKVGKEGYCRFQQVLKTGYTGTKMISVLARAKHESAGRTEIYGLKVYGLD